MTLQTVPVALGERSYDIVIGEHALLSLKARLDPMLKRPRAFVLTDDSVDVWVGGLLPLVLEGIALETLSLKPGETTKSFDTLGRVLNWLIEAGAERSDVLIAYGGGVIGDLAGLAASLMKRGMVFVQVPTTLLAQVDSSVGGKTAVNAVSGKNLIGAFYQPRLVLADSDVLHTLPKRELAAGYAEIVKYGLINDRTFFTWLEANGEDVMALEPEAIAHAVATSCRAKAAIVAEDETETGVRQLLNLGHTFGHALEAANHYRPNLLHGEAVALGCVLALKYSARLGLSPLSDATRAAHVFAKAGLPVSLGALEGGPYRPAHLAELMRSDKKAKGGRVPLILARGIGQAFVHPDADLEDVRAFLEAETAPA